MRRLVFLVAIITAIVAPAWAAEYGVYVKAVERAEGTFDEVVGNTEEALRSSGWEVLASYESGVEEKCGMRAHTIVAHSGNYAKKIIAHGPNAAFALPLRVGVYEDELGIHVDFVNPVSINRTVLGDDVEEELSVDTMEALASAISSNVAGKAVKEQTGQLREKGRVGGMGGGDFEKKVETIHEGTDFETVKESVRESIASNELGWKLVYTLPLDGLVVYGVAKAETEARAFHIAGEKRESKTLRCPGLDHAPAFPIEVVVYSERDSATVVILDEMYRMKLYFEDAGKWVFMKNMTMPGTIEDEVVEVSTSRLRKK